MDELVIDNRDVTAEELLGPLAGDLVRRFGRGFSRQNLQRMRSFYLSWEVVAVEPVLCRGRAICSTGSSKSAAPVARVDPPHHPAAMRPGLFPLPWPHCVRLLSVPNAQARAFYEAVPSTAGTWSSGSPRTSPPRTGAGSPSRTCT